MSEQSPQPSSRPAAVIFIFVTVVLDVLALGIIIPVLPKLVETFSRGRYRTRSRNVRAIRNCLGADAIYFLSGARRALRPIRPPPGHSYFVLWTWRRLHFHGLRADLWLLFIGRIISGITGASFTAAGAYIADVTPPEKRAAGFGMIGAAWGLGFVLGPALGGILGGIDTRLPFWVAAGLTLLNAMYGLFVLPESLSVEHREKFSWKRANPFGSLKLLRSHPELFRLATVNGFFYLAHQVLPSVFVLYASFRYGWNEEAVGLALAIMGACGMIVQGGVVKRVVADFGERHTLLAGLLFGMVGFAIFGLAPVGIIFCLGIPIFSLMGMY